MLHFFQVFNCCFCDFRITSGCGICISATPCFVLDGISFSQISDSSAVHGNYCQVQINNKHDLGVNNTSFMSKSEGFILYL